MQKFMKGKKGFTLAELLIVVAIVGVLSAVAIFIFSSHLEKSREATDIANLRSAKATAVSKYLADDLIDGVFYFDTQKGVLVSEDDFTDGSITGYGKGTEKNGSSANTFDVSAIANGSISMCWIDTDGSSNANTDNYTPDIDVSGQIIKVTFGVGSSNPGGSGGSSNPGGSGGSPGSETCTHTYDKYVSNNDGTHQVLCSKCDDVNNASEDCNYVSGTCDKCGYSDPNASNEPIIAGSATFKDGVTLTWEELQHSDNGTKYSYNASAITDTSIGDSAFYSCTSLTSITIGNSVTTIGDYIFKNCDNLTSITIPSSVTSIGGSAFYYCSSFTEINVDEHNPNYSSVDGVLFNKDQTTLICYPTGKAETTYTIPSSVTSIGDSAFYKCSNLTSIEIPDSVTSIGQLAFYYCTSLTDITIPDGVPSIGRSAFYYCTRLTSINIPSSVTSIGESAFYYCSSLTSITIPNGVTSLGKEAFRSCDNLTSITIPSSVTSIGESAFYYCSSLTSVTISNGVRVIGKSAFKSCGKLTDITIPSSVTGIGDYAFFSCSSLSNITYTGTQALWKAIDKGYNWNSSSTYTIHCTDGDISK